MAYIREKIRGQVGVPVLLTIVGGTAVTIFTALTYVNSQVAPIRAQTQLDATAIASLQADDKDTNEKVNALYNYFVTKGLTAQAARIQPISQ